MQLGDGSGGFLADMPAPIGTSEVTFGDVNGDGNLDVVEAFPAAVGVLLGHGNGEFDMPLFYEAGGVQRSIALADVNNDGRLDIAVNEGPNASVLFGRCLP